jgi:TolB-like protein/DNA-binding winged helix-turn-helix (wHTH) protein/Tfp pilus assembly protein PilF
MAAHPDASRLVRFGVFEVDLRTGELRKNGLKVKLQDQPFQVLAMLLEHPGALVTREELQKRLWSESTFVDFEDGLSKAVYRIREALGDDADNPRFVETLPRRGYRFIYPVAPVSSPAKATAVRDRRSSMRRIAFAAVALVAIIAAVLALNIAGLRDRLFPPSPPKIQSIAVLPLGNLSGDKEQEYFADGMTEALISDLGKIGALRVISRTSVMRFKETKRSIPEVARELNVDAVVEGSVLRSGDRVRITAQLIHPNPEKHLWSGSYERDLRDVLALQAELAAEIARQIKIAVTPEEHALLSARRAVNPEAHQAYLRGRYFWSKRNREGMQKAVEHFQQAIDLDPAYAPAYAGLADAYAVSGGEFLGLTERERYLRTKAAVQKALELDDTLAEVHASLGYMKGTYEWDWAKEELEYRRAIELNPSYAPAHKRLSVLLLMLGRRPEEALRLAKRAVELDPLSPSINSHLCGAYMILGEHDQAIRQCQLTLELDDQHFVPHFYLASVYLQMGKHDRAAHHLEQALLLSEGAEAAREMRGRYQAGGWPGVWRWDVTRLEVRQARGEFVSYGIADAYFRLGDFDNAILALEEGYRRRDPTIAQIAGDPMWDRLRSDPRFQDLLRRMNFPD